MTKSVAFTDPIYSPSIRASLSFGIGRSGRRIILPDAALVPVVRLPQRRPTAAPRRATSGPERHLIQIAAALLWFEAIGLAIPDLIGIRSLLEGRGVATVLGYPSYGGGGFERAGIPTTVPLLLAFLLVLVLEIVAGWWLWQGSRNGAVFALVLLVPSAVFWWGFDLPYPPIIAAIRTLLILLAWGSLRDP
jgi:hypothetical protein